VLDLGIFSMVILLPVVFLVLPNNLYYAYSVFPEGWKNTWTWLGMYVFEAGIIGKGVVIHMVCASFVFMHIFSTRFWLRKVS
jgi:hypothetical protein